MDTRPAILAFTFTGVILALTVVRALVIAAKIPDFALVAAVAVVTVALASSLVADTVVVAVDVAAFVFGTA